MGRIDTNESLELLRRANGHLGRFFERFSGAPVMGADEEVAALFQLERALQLVGGLLDGRLRISGDQQVHQELAHYQENLVHLRNELARMQESAAGCRARLDSRQKHLHAAQAWCAASRATG
jgi:hypothetical protein